ncbi:AAA family ATPase [Rossellomorea vietnamensis]|uniref:AAA family ATPase n=1 Tax=Rossellomorea vietnamensis TaxID=218284 RepID=UPI000556513F|nr:AAA family ATPase [Rossellomorea vietnamensis]
MILKLEGYDGTFRVEVKVDYINNIIHVLDLWDPNSTSLINGIDLNENQQRILNLVDIDKVGDPGYWRWYIYSPGKTNAVYDFNNGEFKEVDRYLYEGFLDKIKKNGSSTSNYFIEEIEIKEFRNIKDLHIKIDCNEKKHLILTGKNGSGKTSLLLELKNYFRSFEDGNFKYLKSWMDSLHNTKNRLFEISANNIENSESILVEKEQLQNHMKSLNNSLDRYGKLKPAFSETYELLDSYENGNFIIAYFDSKRTTNMVVPDSIRKIKLNLKYNADDRPSNIFIQYLVNMKAEQAFANQSDNQDLVKKIDYWFENLERAFSELFESENFKLEFDFKEMNFFIKEKNKAKYSFEHLSDGYSSVISIVSDIMMRMENKVNANGIYNLEGIVLIDELETHLHVSLQKKIFPFLLAIFPRIQFIVTTHSPFVLSSAENSVIYDLENNLRIEDLTPYSYEGIVEGYFGIDKYSKSIKEKIDRYKTLINNYENLTEEEEEEVILIKRYIKQVPDKFAQELKLKFYDLELLRREKMKK